MEDFEGKVDQIKEGGADINIDESPSWIHDIFNRYSEYFTLNDTNVEVEDLEPPMLDETWGLKDSNSVDENATKPIPKKKLQDQEFAKFAEGKYLVFLVCLHFFV